MRFKISPQQQLRLDALQGALDFYGASVEDYDDDEVEENLRPAFAGTKPVGKYCTVTDHDGKYFFLPWYDTLTEAKERAVEYAHDDLYAEIPVAVVDLDSGESIRANLQLVSWVEGEPVIDQASRGRC